MKISWSESHLVDLMSMLTKWVTSDPDEELIALSLGVLANLTYKNLPALYTLLRTVDIKKFLKLVLKSQMNNQHTRVQVGYSVRILYINYRNYKLSEKLFKGSCHRWLIQWV